jgi:hypothetical protein
MTAHKSTWETILWLDVAIAAQRGTVVASIYPVDVGVDAPSFAVTIDHRWVAGGDGRLSVFETPQVAHRFLDLLGITKVQWKGAGMLPKLAGHLHFRKFYLSSNKLVDDTDCHESSALKSATSAKGLHKGEGATLTNG